MVSISHFIFVHVLIYIIYIQGSKVETEIMRLQREIEKSESERSRIKDWERRKFSRSHNCSMDSLLSFDSDASSTYGFNAKASSKTREGLKMPPKGKFSSTTSLLTNVQKQILLKNEQSTHLPKQLNKVEKSSSPPPALPPKKLSNTSTKPSIVSKSSNQEKETSNSHKNSTPKRRVSISTEAVEIIGHSGSEDNYKDDIPRKENSIRNSEEGNSVTLPLQKENQGRMSVPDIIPSHELNDVVCMQNQAKANTKPLLKKHGLSFEQKKSKNWSIYGSNKDLEDLTEKGLPSVKDLVNKFLPNRTASVDLYQNPEPSPRQSLLQKVIN